MQKILFEGKFIERQNLSEEEMWAALIKATQELDYFSGALEVFLNMSEGAQTPMEVKEFADRASGSL